jgi:hypothetical protein
VTFAAISFLILTLEASDVGGVCRERCPDADADCDIMLPDEEIFALLFPFELSVSVVCVMTVVHNRAVCAGSVAGTIKRRIDLSDCEGGDDDDDDNEDEEMVNDRGSGDSVVCLRAEELTVGCM